MQKTGNLQFYKLIKSVKYWYDNPFVFQYLSFCVWSFKFGQPQQFFVYLH